TGPSKWRVSWLSFTRANQHRSFLPRFLARIAGAEDRCESGTSHPCRKISSCAKGKRTRRLSPCDNPRDRQNAGRCCSELLLRLHVRTKEYHDPRPSASTGRFS